MPNILLGFYSYSFNPPISIAAPKPLSSNMDSRSVFPTKISSFTYSNVYPQISLKPLAPFGGVIKSKAVTSSLSGKDLYVKVGYFSFGSSVSAFAVSKPKFDIKSTEDKTNIYTPMLFGTGEKVMTFGSLSTRASPKCSGGGFSAYYSTSGSGCFKFESS